MKRDQGFEDLRTLFAADLAEKVSDLQTAVRDADWETISRISHQIIGTAKSFGYPEISSLAVDLERSVGQCSLQYSADLVKKLSDLSRGSRRTPSEDPFGFVL